MNRCAVKLTQESIQAARQQLAENAMACIAEVECGEVHVNDVDAYRAWRQQESADALAGRYDHTLTLLQLAHFIQTGECPAILP